jgi:hypothetical protein
MGDARQQPNLFLLGCRSVAHSDPRVRRESKKSGSFKAVSLDCEMVVTIQTMSASLRTAANVLCTHLTKLQYVVCNNIAVA